MEDTQTEDTAATVPAEPAPAAAETEAAPTAAPASLEERVAYLEAQNEGLKRVGGLGLALVLLLGALLVYQTYSDLNMTSTRGITLLNNNNELTMAVTSDTGGRTQFIPARFGVLPNGTEDPPPNFEGYTFYDTQGKPRFMVGQNKDTQETVFVVLDPVRGAAFDPFQNTKSAAGARAPQPAGSATPAPASSPTP